MLYKYTPNSKNPKLSPFHTVYGVFAMVKRITHIVFGLGLAIYLNNPQLKILAWCGFSAFLGSIVPDLDLKYKHRVLLHNVFSLMLISTIVAVLLKLTSIYNFNYVWAFTIGYMSHILSDAFTKTGVTLFYPISNRRIRFTKARYDNPLLNIAFIVIGLILIVKYIVNYVGI